MMAKYTELILTILSSTKIKSTNEILKELEHRTGKVINWHALHRVLFDLFLQGKIERLEAKAGFFWRKNGF